ncbi:transposase [Komagataeibacter nataicola NRIC 0616]|uniref:Transposase IS4-like domain-containing protein n=1 Tax=Komagataeibacter nataicola TaxID=265960 RepID=A0ABX5PCU5_9PROT|nr:hypothetical protein CDI09_06960 [Komagataeibacter nataicola]GBR26060.1 transposase [Komagataeibacter nataicola NRIC 0616]
MDQAIGRSRGRLTTKIHAICDSRGNPVEIDITPGQDADITLAQQLLERIGPDAFLADKAYDSDSLIDRLMQRGIPPGHPAKKRQDNTTGNGLRSLPET